MDQALSEPGNQSQQLPVELLDEQIPASDVGELLPPLPACGLHAQTHEQSLVEEAPKEQPREARAVRA